MVAVSLKKYFFQAEDGIRDLLSSRGLGDVYKRQPDSEEYDHSFERNGQAVYPVVDVVNA